MATSATRAAGDSAKSFAERLLDVVEEHGLLLYAGHFLSYASGDEAAHAAALRDLEARRRRQTHRSLRLTGELLAVLDLFASHEIQVVPFKGPLLAVQLYGDPASRTYQDIDVVVRDADADRALALLEARGYEPPPDVRRVSFPWWRRWNDQCRLERDGLTLELHWTLDLRGFLPWSFDAAWEGLEPVRLGGRVVRTLSREQLVLYLAAHGAKHAWERLGWLFDFSQLVSTFSNLDWARIAQDAGARGSERALLLALRLARDVTGVAPPPALAARVAQDRRVGALADRVYSGLCGERPVTVRLWTLQAFHLRVQERLRDRVRYLTTLLFAPGPADWALIALPGWLSWLYALIKPIRVGAELAGRLKGDSERLLQERPPVRR